MIQCGGGIPTVTPGNMGVPTAQTATGEATASGTVATGGATPAPTTGATVVPTTTASPAGTSTQAPAGATTTATGTGAANAGAYPFTYTDAFGTKVTLEERPDRIVSLFSVNNDTLFAIGAGDQVIAVDDFTMSPREAAEKPKVGGNGFKFNLESIVALKPDLVLTNIGTQEIVDQPLRKAGVKVIATPTYPSTLRDTYKLMRDLGRLTGHTAEAEKEVARLQQTADEVRARVGKARKVRTYYETDISTPGKPYIANAFDIRNDLIQLAGGRNVFSDVQSGQVSYESIVKANPEVILLGNVKGYVGPLFANPTTVAEVKARKGFNTTAAVRNNRVVPMYPSRFVPGPELNQGIRDIAVALHPEIFGER